jgi:hypothetical protein
VINDFNGDDIIINRACVSPIHDDFQQLHHGENLFYSEQLIFLIPTCIKLGHPSCKIKNFKSRFCIVEVHVWTMVRLWLGIF